MFGWFKGFFAGPKGVRRRVRWFDKVTLKASVRFTNEWQLGEPPTEALIDSHPDEKFPIVFECFHRKAPGVDWDSFYRCCIFVNGDGYRVAVPLHIWEKLPVDDFDLTW